MNMLLVSTQEKYHKIPFCYSFVRLIPRRPRPLTPCWSLRGSVPCRGCRGRSDDFQSVGAVEMQKATRFPDQLEENKNRF